MELLNVCTEFLELFEFPGDFDIVFALRKPQNIEIYR
jgi:hypothetical protein